MKGKKKKKGLKKWLKSREKDLRHFVGRLALKACYVVANLVPLRGSLWLSQRLADGAYGLLGKYRRKVFSNLYLALSEEKSSEELEALAQSIGRNAFCSFVEMLRAVNYSREEIKALLALEGREHLDRALEKGRGVIAIGAHMGNFTLMGARLAAEPYPFNLIVKDPTDPHLARFFDRLRDRQGQKTIPAMPRNLCVSLVLKRLKDGEIVFFMLDENKSGGVFVPFFSRPAATASGPAVFALKTQAPVLPMAIVRVEGLRHKLIIGPEIELQRSTDRKRDIVLNTALFIRPLEELIRAYPDQWNWFNPRWKTKPKERDLELLESLELGEGG